MATRPNSISRPHPYHHGDLPTALVEVALERKAMFAVLCSAALDKASLPALQAWGALAQGHATLVNDGAFGPPSDVLERAGAATKALVAGRRHLFAATTVSSAVRSQTSRWPDASVNRS